MNTVSGVDGEEEDELEGVESSGFYDHKKGTFCAYSLRPSEGEIAQALEDDPEVNPADMEADVPEGAVEDLLDLLQRMREKMAAKAKTLGYERAIFVDYDFEVVTYAEEFDLAFEGLTA
jgi:hypothetical protein